MIIMPGYPTRHFPLPRPIKRFIPNDRRPMHNPPLWQVIRIGIVLSHTVIPNRNIIWLPTPTHLKLRFGDMGKQKLNKASLSFSLTSTIRVVKPSFTNSACLPLTGCVRTTGCSNGRFFATASRQR